MTLHSYIRPIIKGKVGDKEAYFLLDTGSNLSLIDSNQIDKYGLNVGQEFPGTLVGTGGITEHTHYCISIIIIGGRELSEFIILDLSSIKNSILRETGFEILGVIGYSQMKELEIIINPAKNEINGI